MNRAEHTALKALPVAVLLTDLEMPEMEGLELLREVKARADDVEVMPVALSTT